jgi:hypothetical protein
MPSQAIQDVIDTLRGQQKAAASQPSPMAGTPEAAQATEQTGDFLRTRVR